jgi:hypothetical protein
MISKKNIVKISIQFLFLFINNRTFSQDVLLENLKINSLILNFPNHFKFCITNGYILDTLYTNDGNVQLMNEGELFFIPNHTDLVKINFLIRNIKGDSFLLEKIFKSVLMPNPHLIFSNGILRINNYNLNNIDSLRIGLTWPEAHAPCDLISFKILILFKDSSTKIFSCIEKKIPLEFHEFIAENKSKVEEIIFFNVRVKTAAGGSILIEPVHFYGTE